MKLLSKELVSLEYRNLLRQDMAKAAVCRFMVAYISQDGLNTINRPLLHKVLRDPRSFGVGSISCACSYEPLLNLQAELGSGTPVRLKYFMDPAIKPDNEPGISLFHSKLVYLYLEREKKSVVYIGSHNWTGRALGPASPRNAEASLRLEFDFAPEHLEGVGNSLPAEVNRHLLDAWHSPACYPATASSQAAFDEWMQKVCKRAPDSPVKEIIVLLAVCKAPPQPSDWLNLQDAGIYFQALDEREGRQVYDSNEALILVWNSRASLAAAEQPVILRCRKTSSVAGPNSELAGNNAATSPMAGYKAIVFDETRLTALQQGGKAIAPAIKTWSGRVADVFDFEFPTTRTQSAQVDGTVDPLYQIYWQTEAVVFPANDRTPAGAKFVWERETFAVAKSKDAARLEESPGYFALPDAKDSILKFFEQVLQVKPTEARVLPYSEADAKVGKRVSQHPLHDTFISPESKQSRKDFYDKSGAGALVADIDAPQARRKSDELISDGEFLPRVQRVFTMPLADLLSLWKETAHRFASQARTNE